MGRRRVSLEEQLEFEALSADDSEYQTYSEENAAAFERKRREMASVNKKFKRSTVEKKIQVLQDRARSYNELLELDERVYKLDGVVLFGSYINSDNQTIGGLDIGILCTYVGYDTDETQGNIRFYLHNYGHIVPDGRKPAECISKFSLVKNKLCRYGYDEMFKYLKYGRKIREEPILDFIKEHRINLVLESCNKNCEMPYIFYGKYSWLCRNNEEKCAELDKTVFDLREQYLKHELRAPFANISDAAKEKLMERNKVEQTESEDNNGLLDTSESSSDE